MLIQVGIAAIIFSIMLIGFTNMQLQKIENDKADTAANQLVKVTHTVAARLFELGGTLAVRIGYTGGRPPGAVGSLLWLKDPNNCSLANIPSLPNDADGNPVDSSFLPCDFSDTNIFGQSYTISWSGSYPNTIATIQLGNVPFDVEGRPRPDIGGAIALRANALTQAGLGDATLDLMIDYRYQPQTQQLTGVISRTSGANADPFLRIDGTNQMDRQASIRWGGSGISIGPDTTDDSKLIMEASGGFEIQGDTLIDGELTVTRTAEAKDFIIGDVTIGGNKVKASQAVFDERIITSGSSVTKPTCPGGSTAQITAVPVRYPVGASTTIRDLNGNRHTGSVNKIEIRTTDSANSWTVTLRTSIGRRGWINVSGQDASLKVSLKCG